MAIMDSTWGADHLKRNEVFNDQLKEFFEEELMAEKFVRNIDGFGDGDNFKVSSIGELTVDQVSESVSLPERRPDTGQFVFNINEFVGVKVPYTDKFLEDDFLAPAAIAATPRKMKRAYDEYRETQILKLHRVQTNDSPNNVNSVAHRLVANGQDSGATENNTMSVEDFAFARYALRKANAPLTGLIALVGPSFEFNTNIRTGISDVTYNPRWEGIIESGIGDNTGMRFIRNIYGFDVLVTDFIDTTDADEAALLTYDGGTPTTASTAGFDANMFFSAGDQDAMPFIGAMRRAPRIESWRDPDVETEYHQLTARFGLNLWRPESLVTILSNSVLN